MDDENINNDLNSEEFEDFLSKYNEYFDKNKLNNADLSFLDKEEHPRDEEVMELFLTPDDYDNSVSIADYNLKELGVPHLIKTLEGTEWKVSKLVWFRPEGRIISFALIKMNEGNELGLKYNSDFGLAHAQEITDVEHEVIDVETYQELLDEAIEIEDYVEAARLRDWGAQLKEYLKDMDIALEKDDIDEFYEIVEILNEHKNLL
jgi:hypothetical protein